MIGASLCQIQYQLSQLKGELDSKESSKMMIVLGLSDGLREGLLEGEPLGSLLSEGLSEWLSEGLSLGCSDGTSLGLADGLQVGQQTSSQSNESASRQGHNVMQFRLHDPSRSLWALWIATALSLILIL